MLENHPTVVVSSQIWLTQSCNLECADRPQLALIHTRQGNFRVAFSLRARQGSIPDAYDARTTRTWPVRRSGNPSARADSELDSESRERLDLDAIDATDEAGHLDAIDTQHDATDAKKTHNTPNLEHPPRARRRPFQMLERLRRRRPRRSI